MAKTMLTWAILLLAILLISGCTLEKTYTVDEIIVSPSEYEGKTITIQGAVEKANCMCTNMECPPENECCNDCSCREILKGETSSIILKDYQCTGTSCEQTCDLEPGEHTLTGTLSSLYGEYYLDVNK